jgi:hypothetical protein
MLVSVILFRRMADLERRYVVLARELAIRQAKEPDGQESSKTDPDE